jgi:two-component system CheB/CheR fusion protein
VPFFLSPDASSEANKSAKLRILIVDDNKTFMETFSWMLVALGHEVRCLYNGTEALAEAQSFLPHVVLLDLGLPEMDGYEVCTQLRSLPALEDVFIVAQTGYSGDEYKEKSKAAGFNLHLVKPVKIEVMEDVLKSYKCSYRAA